MINTGLRLAGLSLCLGCNNVAAVVDLALEETLVTAQKRLENVNDVPVAITVFSEQLIESARITSVMNIAQMTPGLAISSYNKTTPAPYIRGIGTNNSHVADDPSVGVFIDEVYISRPGSFDTPLFDLERIEVLRGPQGTLWGKNVAGGAISMVTRAPIDELEGRASLTLGNFSRQEAGLYLNGPISDTVMGKIAVSSLERDGYIDNRRIGGDVADDDVQSARGALLWMPSDDLEVRWNIDGSRDRAQGVGRVVLEGSPPPPPGFPLPPRLEDYSTNESYTNGYTDRDVWGSSLHLGYARGDSYFTSISAYRDSDYSFMDAFIPADVTLFGFPSAYELVLTNEVEEEADQFSQELRWTHFHDPLALDWTLGLYYFEDSIERREYLVGRADAQNDTESRAVFGQANEFLDEHEDWRLTLGARYTWERKEFEQLTLDARSRETWDKTTFRFGLDYRGLDNGLLYLGYAEGFKSGAFNVFSFTAEQAETPLDPEWSKQWEIGAKLHWLDHSLQTNIALFYIDYDDIQVFETRPDLTFYIVNAVATSQGVELDVSYQPVAGLTLGMTYAYLDAEYDDYQTETLDFSGNTLQRAPEHSGSLSAQYERELEGGYRLLLRSDLTYQDDMYFSSSENPSAISESHTLVNLRAEVDLPGEHWNVSLWGKNVFDEEYVVFENDARGAGFPGLKSSIPGAPRTYGVTVDYRL